MWNAIKSAATTRRVAIGVAAALAIALVPSLVTAQAANTQLRASLTGTSEVPANASTATGTFTASLDEGTGTLSWTLTVPTITAATMAHLHQGASGANGGVVLDLFIPAAPANTISQTGSSKLADLKGPLAGNFAGFVAALKSGGIYANVHTTANPGGEIRGQVAVVTATPAPTVAAPTPAATAAPAATTAPAPGKTGTGGLARGEGATSLLMVVGFAVAAAAAVAVARRATKRS